MMESSPGLIPVFNQVSHTQLAYLSRCLILAQNQNPVQIMSYITQIKLKMAVHVFKAASQGRLLYHQLRQLTRSVHRFSIITSLLHVCRFMGSDTRPVHRLSSITGLQGQF